MKHQTLAKVTEIDKKSKNRQNQPLVQADFFHVTPQCEVNAISGGKKNKTIYQK